MSNPGFDEAVAMICAAKGLPYSAAEWEREVLRLEYALEDARRRWLSAHQTGYCHPARFDPAGAS
jgi:hypothetical protein